MLTNENRVGKALQYLAQTDEGFAALRANLLRLEKIEKTILARALLESSGTVAEKDAQARTSGPYEQWITDYDVAVLDYETMKVKRSHEELVIEVWRTESANARRGNV